jgi:hypothetical protein
VHAPSGQRIAELATAHNVECTWLARFEPGVASVTIARNDPQADSDTLRLGNYLVVQGPTIPPWVGKLRAPAESLDGVVELAARDLVAELGDRTTGQTRHYTASVGSGTLFAAIIRNANRREHTGVNPPATIPSGPALTDYSEGGQSALQDVQALQEQTDFEAWLDADVSPSHINVVARWGREQGQDVSSLVHLWEGIHFAEAEYRLELPPGAVLTIGGVEEIASRTVAGAATAAPKSSTTTIAPDAVRRFAEARSGVTRPERVVLDPTVTSRTELARRSARDLSRAVSSAEQHSVSVIEATLSREELLLLSVGNYVTIHRRTALSGSIARVVRITGVQPSFETGLRMLNLEGALR